MGITSRFDATSTAAEVAAGTDLSGTTAVVTGGSSGIGVETARALAGAGAAVTLAVRDTAAGDRTAEDIAATTGAAVRVAALDLADPASVEAFVAAWEGPLHLLVANAGVMTPPLTRTADGWELQLAVNHLGHFALATGLHGALAADGAARVVVVSSSGHASSPVLFDDPSFERRPYDPGVAYGQSKTANVLFAVEATRRWVGDGITANAVMPGGIFTNLQRHWDPQVREGMKEQFASVSKTPEQGAATSVWAATSPDLAGVGGLYLEDCHEAEVVDAVTDGLHGVVPHALDPDAARRLWELSEEMLAGSRARRGV
ncbi:SDR family NAD(P)-dependent oxidoreductase [Aquipuribacter sp. SD81]|uniref:SDR family NAD(P)-dependent oxidoreductase n=1 Tax=Aquipuribacter sp. SD81 TaxID=3127703 RepID=UPI003016897D